MDEAQRLFTDGKKLDLKGYIMIPSLSSRKSVLW